jgi:hypothetical protein
MKACKCSDLYFWYVYVHRFWDMNQDLTLVEHKCYLVGFPL